MCGHCIVEGYLSMRVDEPLKAVPEHLEPPFLDMAVMHATDIRATLWALKALPKAGDVDADIAVCLALELFLSEGFDSELACWVDWQYADRWRALSKERPVLGAETRLAQTLLNPAFWQSPELLADLTARGEEAVQEAEAIVTAYRDWWLLENGNIPAPSPDERLSITGVMDPIQNTSREDWEKFYASFPVVYAAALWLARRPGGHPLLTELVVAYRPQVPDFTGLDLWLQRRALAWVCQTQGMDFVRQEIGRINWMGLVDVALRQAWDAGRKAYVRDVIARGECDVGVGMPEVFLEECPGW